MSDPRARTARASTRQRAFAASIAAACLGILITAAILSPAHAGIGTHKQLGLPECGWLIALGSPCPTCGMTTAFAHAADFQPLDALRAQPLGAVLALAAAVIMWGALHVALTGSQIGKPVGRLIRPRSMWALAVATAAAWAYKVATYTRPS